MRLQYTSELRGEWHWPVCHGVPCTCRCRRNVSDLTLLLLLRDTYQLQYVEASGTETIDMPLTLYYSLV